jgi:ABC-type nitrate/sulfonate/bicarbonate transport system substrate-binding protein
MFPLLSLGYLDGFCAGEPWTSVAVHAGVGHCVATSVALSPLHPEKVLMVREDFAQKRATEHERLIAALIEACEICDEPDNRADLCKLLAGPRYVDAPLECLQPGLIGPFGVEDSGIFSLHGLHIFNQCRANAPTAARAAWITRRFHNYLRWRVRPTGLDKVFRPDIFKRAQQVREQMRRQDAEAGTSYKAGRMARA